MRLVTPRSEVVMDEAGWTWLQPRTGSTRARHTLGTFLLAVLILIALATSTLLPRPASVAATALVIGVGAILLARIVRGAASRVALGGVGIYLQNGGQAHQVGWPAVRGVSGRPRRRRVHIVIDDGYRPRATRATFDAEHARQWLRLAAEEARRRRLEPVMLDDDLGFTSADRGAGGAT